mmetsp:Transcript_37350/g.61558  ORF Transcript_37350/g.61558 Transcript_37350/m.61558 type:complete len:215 (+) Transcript_37350:337-981(+)
MHKVLISQNKDHVDDADCCREVTYRFRNVINRVLLVLDLLELAAKIVPLSQKSKGQTEDTPQDSNSDVDPNTKQASRLYCEIVIENGVQACHVEPPSRTAAQRYLVLIKLLHSWPTCDLEIVCEATSYLWKQLCQRSSAGDVSGTILLDPSHDFLSHIQFQFAFQTCFVHIDSLVDVEVISQVLVRDCIEEFEILDDHHEERPDGYILEQSCDL